MIFQFFPSLFTILTTGSVCLMWYLITSLHNYSGWSVSMLSAGRRHAEGLQLVAEQHDTWSVHTLTHAFRHTQKHCSIARIWALGVLHHFSAIVIGPFTTVVSDNRVRKRKLVNTLEQNPTINKAKMQINKLQFRCNIMQKKRGSLWCLARDI